MQQVNFFYIVITAMLALLGFFSVRFYMMVDEVRKDVKSILIGNGTRDEKLTNVEKKVDDIEITLKDHGEKLNRLELDVANLKQ